MFCLTLKGPKVLYMLYRPIDAFSFKLNLLLKRKKRKTLRVTLIPSFIGHVMLSPFPLSVTANLRQYQMWSKPEEKLYSFVNIISIAIKLGMQLDNTNSYLEPLPDTECKVKKSPKTVM